MKQQINKVTGSVFYSLNIVLKPAELFRRMVGGDFLLIAYQYFQPAIENIHQEKDLVVLHVYLQTSACIFPRNWLRTSPAFYLPGQYWSTFLQWQIFTNGPLSELRFKAKGIQWNLAWRHQQRAGKKMEEPCRRIYSFSSPGRMGKFALPHYRSSFRPVKIFIMSASMKRCHFAHCMCRAH